MENNSDFHEEGLLSSQMQSETPLLFEQIFVKGNPRNINNNNNINNGLGQNQNPNGVKPLKNNKKGPPANTLLSKAQSKEGPETPITKKSKVEAEDAVQGKNNHENNNNENNNNENNDLPVINNRQDQSASGASKLEKKRVGRKSKKQLELEEQERKKNEGENTNTHDEQVEGEKPRRKYTRKTDPKPPKEKKNPKEKPKRVTKEKPTPTQQKGKRGPKAKNTDNNNNNNTTNNTNNNNNNNDPDEIKQTQQPQDIQSNSNATTSEGLDEKREIDDAEFSKKEKSRTDNSLIIHTQKFVECLRSAPNATLDLSAAVGQLGFPKRRIYDITNVLEGINLIDKKSKNNVQWLGVPSDAVVVPDIEDSVTLLLDTELFNLAKLEQQLDTDTIELQNQLSQFLEKPSMFVTHQDIGGLPAMQDKTIIAIRPPSGTTLEVPDPNDEVEEGRRRYQIYLSSSTQPIDVYLVTHKQDNQDPDHPHQQGAQLFPAQGIPENPPILSTNNNNNLNQMENNNLQGGIPIQQGHQSQSQEFAQPAPASFNLYGLIGSPTKGIEHVGLDDYDFQMYQPEGISDFYD